MYDLEDEPSFRIELVHVIKEFSKKPIQQILVLPNSKSLVVVTELLVTVCDLATLTARTPLEKVKGCRTVGRWSQTGETMDLIALAVRRGVYLYAVSHYQVTEIKFISLPTSPHQLLFLDAERILFSSKWMLGRVDLQSEVTVLDRAGSSLLPNLSGAQLPLYHFCLLNEESVLFSHGRDGYKMNLDGTNKTKLLEWTEFVNFVAYDDYYVMGWMENVLEIRSLKTGTLLQSLVFEKLDKVCQGQLWYANTSHDVWRLLPLDFEDQIDELLANNRFADASAFLEELEFPTPEDKASNVLKVRGIFAQYLFNSEKRYEEAIQILEELNASPLDVVELFPRLSPLAGMGDPSIELGYFFNLDQDAYLLLSQYLARERVRLTKYRGDIEREVPNLKRRKSLSDLASPSLISYPTYADALYLSEFVDTTLMKSYILTNSKLLASLMRLENFCDKVLTEKALIEAKKVDELLDFFKTRGLHEEALSFLQKTDLVVQKIEKMVGYLKTIELDTYYDLFFEYMREPLQQSPQDAIKVFTENANTTSLKTRTFIVHFLDEISGSLATTYLEYLIFTENDPSVDINNSLFLKYLKNYEKEKKNKDKLVSFILETCHYDLEFAIARLPKQGGLS